jgi:hypothetical protein
MKRRKNIKHEMEYEEAPSGYATFYNYKEPLMKFEGGFGYVGALVFDGKTDKIQCHFCGEWLGSLPHHLAREHNMTASDYKEKVGLFQTTALISESARAKLIASGLDRRKQNLRYGKKKTQAEKDKISATLKRNGQKEEGKNLRGTCPAQLIDRMQKIAQEKGDKLVMRDFDGFDELLKLTFGSVKEACQIANVPYNLAGKKKVKSKYTEEKAVNFIKEYIVRFKSVPARSDFIKNKERGLYDTVIKSEKKLKKLSIIAYQNIDEYVKCEERMTYTKQNLLKYMQNFNKNNGRHPAVSDTKRKLIPSFAVYQYHFGSWKNALQEAFKQ